MSKRAKLETWMADTAGQKGTQIVDMIGHRYFHPKTGGLYKVVGIGYDSERERWIVRYVPEHPDELGFEFTHLPEDFNREGRFLQVRK